LESVSGYPFSSFPSGSCTDLLLGGKWFPSCFCLPNIALAITTVPILGITPYCLACNNNNGDFWWSASSQAVWELASGGAEALLFSPFIVEWGYCAWAGGVEESEFCLFFVISPRFYFRKHATYFLPLVAILSQFFHLFLK
jgi:hypothetical protein